MLRAACRGLRLPTLYGDVDTVPLWIMQSVLSVGNPVRPLRAASDACDLGAVAYVVDVLDMEAKVIVAVFFLACALVKQRDIEIAVRNENRRAVRIGDFLHLENALIKFR